MFFYYGQRGAQLVMVYIVKAFQNKILKAEYHFESVKSAMIFATRMREYGYNINFKRMKLDE